MPGSRIPPLLACALIVANTSLFAADRQDVPPLLLDVVINRRPAGFIGQFQLRGGELYATRAELDQLGVRVHGATLAGGADIALSSVPGLSWSINMQSQTVYFTAAANLLKPTVLTVRPPGDAAALKAESGIGAVLNYDLVGTQVIARQGTGDTTLAEALLDGRLFSPFGVVTAGVIAATSAQSVSGSQSSLPLERLDTTYSFYAPDALRTYRLGDVITGGLSWSRPVRLAGGQVSTDFSLRPDLVTFPVPTIAGQVAVPSSIDVLVNGVELLSRHIQPGPFEIPQLPLLNGTGDVSLSIHGENGEESRQTLPLYSSNLLLQPGLTAYSLELGVVRLNYAEPDDTYGAPAASASVRAGVLEWLTLEGHAEASGPADADGVRTSTGGLAGSSAALTLGRLGALSLSGAASRFGGRSGGLLAASYERVSPMISLGGGIQTASGGFNDIAGANGDPVPKLQLRANAGASLGRLGSLALAFVDIVNSRSHAAQLIDAAAQSAQLQADPSAFGLGGASLPKAENVSLLSVTFNRQVLRGRATIFATGFHDFAGSAASGLSVGFTIALGSRDAEGISANLGEHLSGATLQSSRTADTVGDLGWRLLGDGGQDSRESALGEYKSSFGILAAGVDHYGDQSIVRGSIQGALTAMDGHIFATNTIEDSFAVVDTTGTSGVTVLQENRPVGRTGSDGLLLVTDLRAFEANRLAIDPIDIPPDVEIKSVERMVRPERRAGVVVTFPVHASRGAMLAFVEASGKAVPVGSVVRLPGHPGVFEIGYGGEAFVTGLQPHNQAIVTYANGSQCQIGFSYHAAARSIPRLGPLRCVAAFHDR